WNGNLRTFIKLAGSEMYINKLKSGLIPVLKEDRATPDSSIKSAKELYTEFTLLVDKNLFTYFFQPIVYAKTGEIYAYEALMRTKGGINMSPLRILDIAKENNMLYDIEKASMFYVMERYDRDRELFGNALIFINTIPGSFLNKHDISKLKEKYQQYISNFVFEITEQDTVSDEELQTIRDLGAAGNSDAPGGSDIVRIAIDEYGTGQSNIVNLLRYSPYIIKIDRFLINNIQNEPNKQMFVKSTIEFAKMNDIKVLAEGVETYEEMNTVIGFGVDLLPGYYTSRPAPVPVGKIPDKIRDEIAAENLNISRYDNELLVYRPKDGESFELSDLALRKFGCIHLSGGSFTITGNDNVPIDTVIKVDDGAAADITIDSASIRSLHSPAVQLGKNCKAVIRLRGNNVISGSGILVPQSSSLLITGDGNLDISVSFNNGVGIGNDYYGSFGNITFEHSGRISVESQGDIGICIGGSISDASPLKFRSGIVYVTAKCVNSLGIGCISGKTDIVISDDAVINVRCAGKNSVGIGSFEGETHICSKGNVDVVSDGERSAAVGTIGTGVLTFLNEGGRINAVVHGNNSVCIGSLTGRTDVTILSGHVNAYGEGDAVCGVGSAEGSGKIRISGGVTAVKLLSGNA
ncbi:MAG: EAL domain-containing protein, partial [Ruminiclostridium sp.]|nr:EAL domain-containing protein [Ruminiclostridium sp.]